MSTPMSRAVANPHKLMHAELNAICGYGHSRYRVVTDWIEFMFWAFQRNDPQYLTVLDRYAAHGKKQDVAEHFANALGALMLHMRDTNEETLGELYMEFCANERMGQFFTPMPICKLMARMTAYDGIPEGRTFRVSEPCAGSGRMIVALAQEMLSEQADRCFFFAQELDHTCCMMTALNMMFFNLQGMIVWGNALDIKDVRGAWVTQRSHLWGGSIAPYPKEKAATQIMDMWESTLRDRQGLAAPAPPPTAKGRRPLSPPPIGQRPVQLRLF